MVRNTTAGLTSVVVPVLHEQTGIAKVLENVTLAAGNLPVQIIVADGDENGSTLAVLPDDDHVTGVVAPRGRGAQMNVGAEVATGDVLIFLHADTRLPSGAVQMVRQAVLVADAGAFSVRYESDSGWVRFLGGVSNLRARLERVAYGDQTHFFRTDVFHRLGGYPEVPIMEDVEMFQRLRRSGHGVVFLPQSVVTSARRYEVEGKFRRPFKNLLLRLRHRLGVPPETLAEGYRPQCELER